MLQDKLDELKEFILQHNGYFNNAYSGVYVDQQTGVIYKGQEAVFPNDTLGDYFYLRQANSTQLQYTQLSTGTQGLTLGVPVVLVACLKSGSADILLQNLINTLRAFQPENIRFTSFLFNGSDVILQELAGLTEKANIEAALQRLQSVIISVSFTYSLNMQFQKLNCIQDPCTIC